MKYFTLLLFKYRIVSYVPCPTVLVERVFLRIGSAATDDALQEELHKFLAPVILKLASPHESVRKKVINASLGTCWV